ncbi:MAG: LuxR C-terminal-related transcriptional regulator [Bacteroidales bacterium]
MLLTDFIISNQRFSDQISFDLESMHFNIDALACNNLQTHIIFDHCLKTVSVYNYNTAIYDVIGNNKNSLELSHISSQLNKGDRDTIMRFIRIINKQFIRQDKYIDKKFYFTIKFNISSNITDQGFFIKVVPMVYTPERQLYASLAILNRVDFIGEPVLMMFEIESRQTYLYDLKIRTFIAIEELMLTETECLILRLAGEGAKEVEIAQAIQVSKSTLKRIKQVIFDKLKVKTTSEAIFIACKKGLI